MAYDKIVLRVHVKEDPEAKSRQDLLLCRQASGLAGIATGMCVWRREGSNPVSVELRRVCFSKESADNIYVDSCVSQGSRPACVYGCAKGAIP
jgi:hypothetical protein